MLLFDPALPVHQSRQQGKGYLSLILPAGELLALLLIGEKPAFAEHNGNGGLGEQINRGIPSLDFPGIVRLELADEGGLHGFGQAFAGGVFDAIEHLGPVLVGIGEFVLVNADADGVFLPLQNGQPVVDVFHLLLAQAAGDFSTAQGGVGVPGHDGVVTHKHAELVKHLGNAEIDVLFIHPVDSDAASVKAAVARVDDHRFPGLGRAVDLDHQRLEEHGQSADEQAGSQHG